eukprot:286663_1
MCCFDFLDMKRELGEIVTGFNKHRLDGIRSILNLATAILSILMLVELNKTNKTDLFWMQLFLFIIPNISYEIILYAVILKSSAACDDILLYITIYTLLIWIVIPVLEQEFASDYRIFRILFIIPQTIHPILMIISSLLIINQFKYDNNHSALFIESYILYMVNIISLLMTVRYLSIEWMPTFQLSRIPYYIQIEFFITFIMLFNVFTIDYLFQNNIDFFLLIFANIYIIAAMVFKLFVFYYMPQSTAHRYVMYSESNKQQNAAQIIDNLCIIEAFSKCVSDKNDEQKPLKDVLPSSNWSIRHAIKYEIDSMECLKTLHNFYRTDFQKKKQYLSDNNFFTFGTSYFCLCMGIFMIYIVVLVCIGYIITLVDVEYGLSIIYIILVGMYILWFGFSFVKTFLKYPLRDIRMRIILRKHNINEVARANALKLMEYCRVVIVFDYLPVDIAYIVLLYVLKDENN